MLHQINILLLLLKLLRILKLINLMLKLINKLNKFLLIAINSCFWLAPTKSAKLKISWWPTWLSSGLIFFKALALIRLHFLKHFLCFGILLILLFIALILRTRFKFTTQSFPWICSISCISDIILNDRPTHKKINQKKK